MILSRSAWTAYSFRHRAGRYGCPASSGSLARLRLRPGPRELGVQPSEADGFLRVSGRNPRAFAFDSGKPFWGVGENMGWSEAGRKTPAAMSGAYDRWLTQLAGNGGNLIRVWMASWGFGVEWGGPGGPGNPAGLGNYMYRQGQAYQLDLLFERARELGIQIILVFNNHGQFSARANPEWNGNPYNVKNGGPLSRPADFFTDAVAKGLFLQRLRYIVARWGYASNLMAWEYWNEVDLTDGYDRQAVLQWHAEMTDALKAMDPYRHLISTSFSNFAREASIWRLSGIDFTMTHFYGQPPRGDQDPARSILVRDGEKRAYPKPTFSGEYGLDWTKPSTRDARGVHLHDILWASTVSGAAATAMTWWWDNYVDPKDLYHHLLPVADFVDRIGPGALAGEPVASRVGNVLSPDSDPAGQIWEDRTRRGPIWGRRVEAYGARSPDGSVVLWLRDVRVSWAAMDHGYEPEPIAGLTVNIAGSPGEYRVLWWDTWRGQPVGASTISVTDADDGITLEVPTFQRDIAAFVQESGR